MPCCLRVFPENEELVDLVGSSPQEHGIRPRTGGDRHSPTTEPPEFISGSSHVGALFLRHGTSL